METLGFWGYVAMAATALVLLVGLIHRLVVQANDRKKERVADRLKRKLKPVPIAGRSASPTHSNED